MHGQKISSDNLTDFIISLRGAGDSDNTIKSYQSDLEQFAAWYKETTGEKLSPNLVTSLDVAEYRQYMMTVKEYSPATVNRKLAAIRAWLTWAQQEELIEHLPVMPKPVARQKLAPRALSRNEVNALLRAVERGGNKRDKAIIAVLLYCGLRVGELVKLRLQDVEINERSGKLTVWGKGAKKREVPLRVEARHALAAYLEIRGANSQSDKLFLGQRGPLTVRGVAKILEKYAYQAKLNGLHPHSLRHTCAKNLVDKGVSLDKVAAILGHESLDTTAIYTKASFEDLARAIEGDKEGGV